MSSSANHLGLNPFGGRRESGQGALGGTNRNRAPQQQRFAADHSDAAAFPSSADGLEGGMMPAPFIAIHRPSVAYDTNGLPLLTQMRQQQQQQHDAHSAFGQSGSRAVSPSPSMMGGMGAGGSFAISGAHGGLSVHGGSNLRSNRSFSVSRSGAGGGGGGGGMLDGTRSTYSDRLSMMRERRSMMRGGGADPRRSPQTRGLQVGVGTPQAGGLYPPSSSPQRNLGVSRGGVGFDASGSRSIAPQSPSHLGVGGDRGPAVRIRSPGGAEVRGIGGSSHNSDRDRSETDSSSHSTSDSSSSASSSTFSIGSSLNFDRIRSYFLRRKRGKKYVALNSSSMYVFSGDNKLRIAIFNLIRSKAFEAFIILLIIANCVLLAMNSPDSEEPLWQVQTDYLFTAAFTAEAVLKLFAYGVVLHEGAYFRDPWNILDFAIVLLSYIQLMPDMGNYTALRIFRVLRPLRSLNAVPPLKVIVSGLLHSIKGLANVGILTLIILAIFSIVGVQLWQGKMRYRCQDDFTEDIHDEMYCATSDVGAGFTGRLCPAGFSCVPYENPWMGYVNFDNVFWAFLIVFQCITCEGWSEIQDIAMDMCGWYAAVYFILVVLILNYFILNLALAVINFQFITAKERMEERLREEKEEEDMEMLAAAEEDEDYQRMLLPGEERVNMLDMYNEAAGLDAAEGGGGVGALSEGAASRAGAPSVGFGRAKGHLPTIQMRMLKKTVGGRLIYSMEKSAKIEALAKVRREEREMEALLQLRAEEGGGGGSGEGARLNPPEAGGGIAVIDVFGDGGEGDGLHGREMSAAFGVAGPPPRGRSPAARNPLKVGSPTAAALALMASTEGGGSGGNNSPLPSGHRLNTTMNSSRGGPPSAAHASLHKSASGHSGPPHAAAAGGGVALLPAITLDGPLPLPSRRPSLLADGGGHLGGTVGSLAAAARPTASSSIEIGAGEVAEGVVIGDHAAPLRSARLSVPQPSADGVGVGSTPLSRLSGGPLDTNNLTVGSAKGGGLAVPPAPSANSNRSASTDDAIVRVSAKQKLVEEMNGTLSAGIGLGGGGAAAAGMGSEEAYGAGAGEGAEEIDFEEASALGSVDETPYHQRGYLRRKFDAKFGHLSWYRFTYAKASLMRLWRLWLRVRYYAFCLSEGDPYAWHAFDFEQLRQAAARDLADEDISKRRVPEPPSTLFTKFIVLCVIVNTGFMCASHYGEPELQTQIANIANIVFAAIFGVEMVVRLTAIGFTSYIFDVSNIFDGVITIISLVEVIFLSGSSSFSVLRAFRLLRIFKLMRAIPSLRKILRIAVVAIQDAGYLCVIFLLYLFIAALVGMQLFGDNLKHTDDDPRANFKNFYQSFYTVFEILTRDSWPDIMRMTMRDIGIVSCIYYLICVFMGDFIILNLFLAILISSFDAVADEADDEELDKYRAIDAVKRRPLGTMGALVSEQSKRLLRLADHKLAIVDPAAFLRDPDIIEQAALLSAAEEEEGEGGGQGGAGGVGGIGGMSPAALGGGGEFFGDHPTEEGEVCPLCGDVKRQPFPPPSKLIAPMTADELHSRMCARIALRKAKARVIRDLLEEIGGVGALDADELNMTMGAKVGLSVHQQLQSFKFGEFDVGLGFGAGGMGSGAAGGGGTGISLRDAKPSPETVDELFGRAWEAGLLLNRNADDYFHISSWAPIAGLLKEEQLVLNLHVGEEIVGQSLVAYTRANVPREFFTNGGKSLWLFSPRNKFRVAVTQLITNPWFDRVVLLLILISSVLMAFDNPREPTIEWMVILGRVFTVLFAVEAVLKIIAYGFILHPTAYARDAWNVLDGAIVVISIVAWILESVTSGGQLQALKVLRTLRCLRPLRVINRNRGLRMVISTLVLSMKGIANVALINGLVYLIFAILGVQLFSGSLHYCNDDSIFLKKDCVGTYTVEEYVAMSQEVTKVINGRNVTGNITYYDLANVTTDREWENADFNFDNTYLAFINLLHIVTLDNWGETMWAVIDSTGPDKGPIDNNRPYWGLYFIVFITVGCFFLLNMFVGVIISSFSAVKEKMDGSSMLTKDQKLWVETQRLMLNFRPELRRRPVFPNWSFCRLLFRISESPKFEALTGIAVALNVVFIGMDHYQQSDSFALMLAIANYIFLGCFTLEALIKIGAYGFQYFRSEWNCFDFFLVLIGFVDIVLDGVLPINLGILRVFRVFRIMRMLVLVRRARSVRVLLETLWYSLPSLVNIGTFLLLIFFMYAVLGNQLFGKIKRTYGMTENVNFENFGTSFLFLIQLVTLDNWGVIMLGTMNTKDCEGDECGTAWAPLYYYSFIIIASWVIMNLFVAIILDNFDNTMRLDKSKLKMAHLKKFTDCWTEFDPEATLIMETRNFPALLLSLHSPLGIDRVTDRKRIMQLADDYRIVEHGGVIHFVETMVPMARRVLGVQFSDADLRAHEDHWREQFPSLAKLKILRYRMRRVTVDQYFGATYLSAAYRRRAAYRYVNMLRQEKLARLEEWYDAHNVPPEARGASTRLLQRAEAGRQAAGHDQFALRRVPDDAASVSRASSRANSRLAMSTGGALDAAGTLERRANASHKSSHNADGSRHSNTNLSANNGPTAADEASANNQIIAMLAPRRLSAARGGSVGLGRSVSKESRWRKVPELMGIGKHRRKSQQGSANQDGRFFF